MSTPYRASAQIPPRAKKAKEGTVVTYRAPPSDSAKVRSKADRAARRHVGEDGGRRRFGGSVLVSQPSVDGGDVVCAAQRETAATTTNEEGSGGRKFESSSGRGGRRRVCKYREGGACRSN